MAKILFVWELGAGLGHVTPIKNIVDRLKGKHEVYAALRDVQHADAMLGDKVTYMAAPYSHFKPDNAIDIQSLSGLLYANGFSKPAGLKSLIHAWKSLYALIQPDLVIFDHSPIALLAARGYTFKKMTIGTGFFFPTPRSPMGVFFPRQVTSETLNTISEMESTLLRQTNTVLDALQMPPLGQLHDIYTHVDQSLISSYAEFDHYLDREQAEYIGITALNNGASPKWPKGEGKRIYAYLKPDKLLPQLLQSLKNAAQPTLVYTNEISAEFLEQFRCDTLAFSFEPLNLKEVAEQGDFAILNCNHDTSVELLLRGMPIISLPLQREQQILSRRIDRHGASIRVEPSENTLNDLMDALNRISQDKTYKDNAMNLKQTFASRDPFNAADKQVVAIESLLAELE